MSEQIIITFSDLKKLFLKNKYRLFLFSLGAFAISFFFTAKEEPLSQSEAIFQEVDVTNELSVKDYILGHYIEKSLTLKTEQILASLSIFGEVIKKEGLQIAALDKKKSIWTNIKNNLLLAINKKIDEENDFIFQNVEYGQDLAGGFSLKFNDYSNFEVIQNNSIVKFGQLNQKIELENFSFILTKPVDCLEINKEYKFNVFPLDRVYNQLKKNLKVTAEKENRQELNIFFSYPDRIKGAKILNALMAEYQDHLRRKVEAKTIHQLSYLKRRREEVEKEFDESLNKFVEHSKENIVVDSSFEIESQVKGLLDEKHQYLQRINEIDGILLEYGKNSFENSFFQKDEVYQNLKKDILQTKNDLEKIGMDICEYVDFNYLSKEEQKQKKETIQKEILQVEKYLQNDFSEKKQQLSKYLQLLRFKAKILEEQKFFGDIEGYENLTIAQLQKLISDSTLQLEKLKDECARLNQLLSYSEKWAGFKEIFWGYLSDNRARDLLKEIFDKEQKIEDVINYSTMERERLKNDKELLVPKLFDQIAALKEYKILEIKETSENFKLLNIAIYRKLDKELIILQNKKQEHEIKKIEKVVEEKNYLCQKMEELKGKMIQIPEKLKKKQQMQFNTETYKKMMEQLIQLVELKNINLNLIKIESGPIMLASTDANYKRSKKIFFISALFMFLGMIGGYVYCVFHAALTGFLLSLENLQGRGQKIAGRMASYGKDFNGLSNNDKGTLREIASFCLAGKIIGLNVIKQKNYTDPLLYLLHKMDKKCLFVELSENTATNAVEVVNHKKYDKATVAKGEFLAEFLQTQNFSSFLDEMRKKYDIILLVSPYSARSKTSRVFMRFCEKIVLAFQDEKVNQMEEYFTWNKERDKLLFLSLG